MDTHITMLTNSVPPHSSRCRLHCTQQCASLFTSDSKKDEILLFFHTSRAHEGYGYELNTSVQNPVWQKRCYPTTLYLVFCNSCVYVTLILPTFPFRTLIQYNIYSSNITLTVLNPKEKKKTGPLSTNTTYWRVNFKYVRRLFCQYELW